MTVSVLDRPALNVASTAGPAPAVRVPVVVVTGYLGSGKTTLIASLLARPEMAGTAVIVNELAAAGIDQSIIGDGGGVEVVLLANGCLCCASGSDLRNAVARLCAHRGDRPSGAARILVETSGAADPGPILKQICFDPVLRTRVRFGGVLTLFDAENGAAMLDQDPVGLRQIGLADQLLLTKTDIADAAKVSTACALLRRLNPNAPVIASGDDAVGFIATSGRGISASGISAWFGPASPVVEGLVHDRRLSTWSVFGTKPVVWSRAEHVLRQAFDRNGDAVLRTKGIVWTTGDDRPLVVHGIGLHFHRPVRLTAWDAAPRTRFVVIGFSGAAAVAEAVAEAVGGRVAETRGDNRHVQGTHETAEEHG